MVTTKTWQRGPVECVTDVLTISTCITGSGVKFRLRTNRASWLWFSEEILLKTTSLLRKTQLIFQRRLNLQSLTSFLAVLELCTSLSSSMSWSSNPVLVFSPRSLHNLPVAAACSNAAIFCVFFSCSSWSCLLSCSLFTHCCHDRRQRSNKWRRWNFKDNCSFLKHQEIFGWEIL